jgi:hypothetical protein
VLARPVCNATLNVCVGGCAAAEQRAAAAEAALAEASAQVCRRRSECSHASNIPVSQTARETALRDREADALRQAARSAMDDARATAQKHEAAEALVASLRGQLDGAAAAAAAGEAAGATAMSRYVGC